MTEALFTSKALFEIFKSFSLKRVLNVYKLENKLGAGFSCEKQVNAINTQQLNRGKKLPTRIIKNPI